MSLGGLLMSMLLALMAGLGFFYWWGHRPIEFDTSTPPITNQYEITAKDSGKVFEFSETSRFTIFLNTDLYDLSQLTCGADGILGRISNAPVVAAPLAAARFEVIKGGTCVLHTGNFSVKIIGDSNYGL